MLRICGHGASGKSTFVRHLHQDYLAGKSQTLEADAYIISSTHSKDSFRQYDLQGSTSFYPITASHPARHELNSFKRDIVMLRKEMDFLTPDFSWLPEKRIKAACPVTIVEGITPTFLVADCFDLSIFFYTYAETELQRRLHRDISQRGRNPEFILEDHMHRRRQYELYLQHHPNDFNIIVNQSNHRFLVEKEEWPRLEK